MKEELIAKFEKDTGARTWLPIDYEHDGLTPAEVNYAYYEELSNWLISYYQNREKVAVEGLKKIANGNLWGADAGEDLFAARRVAQYSIKKLQSGATK